MKNFNFIFLVEVILLSLLGLIPFIPVLNSLDLIGPQFLYLSLIQFLFIIYFFFKKDDIYKIYLVNKPLILYTSFIIISFVSIYVSSNINEGLIEFSRYFTLFLTFLSLLILSSFNKNHKYLILYILLILQIIESLYVFKIFIENFSYSIGIGRLRALQGLSSNQNIAAFSLCIKVPIIFYFLIKNKNIIIKILLFVITAISFFDIFVIASRGATLALYFIIFLLLIIIIFRKFFSFNLKLRTLKHFFSVIIIFLAVLITQTLLYKNKAELQVINRSITSYSLEDDSINKRSRYFSHALENIYHNPIIGSGIGSWKVLSIFYDRNEITEYQIPYHAHNDFLHIGAESGVIALFSYLLFFLFVIYGLIKNMFKYKNEEEKLLLNFLLFISITIFLFDSSVNFPRARPYSQMNIIYLAVLSLSFIYQKNDLKLEGRKVLFGLLLLILLLIPVNYINYKLFNSIKDQVYMYFDFNDNRTDLKIPLSTVENWEDELPNLTTSSLPIAFIKSNYYIQQRKYDTAKFLIRKGNKVNPYLGIGELNLARIHMEEENFDSAYYFSKKAVEKLPKNISHISIHQKILAHKKNIKEAKELYRKTKFFNERILMENHALLLIALNDEGKFEYDEQDLEFVNKAFKLYPDGKYIKAAHKIVNAGYSESILADEFDLKAQYFYEKKDFQNAIINWNKAIELIKNENSYYLNISQTYLILGDFENSIKTLKRLDDLELKSQDGKYEFLYAASLSELGQKEKACNFAMISVKKGYQNSKTLAKLICKK